ncbi:MAG TPA: hypothetical protein VK867_12205 [Candidatus Limnocylindrales bacterium]|nr:hypothetical protein [Candidatus Limnocylindrales bacterium]
MKDPLVVGLAAITAIALVPVVLWLFLAAVVSDVGCAWILGLGGCPPR